MDWWIWLLIVLAVVLVLFLLWWFLWRRPKQKAVPVIEPEVKGPVPPDNLQRIEGIGPRISGLLQEAGITTFAQLAESGVDRLEQILSEAGLRRLADPSTWPEQAGLAAAGDWDALARLQDELKGGRRAE
jgi:hypothetical protein